MTLRPTRHAVVLFLVLGAMFLASINYQSNAAWLMVFLVFTTGCMSALHGLRNAMPATAVPGEPTMVAAGDRARLPLLIGNRAGREVLALAVEIPDAALDGEIARLGGRNRLLIPQLEPHGSSRGELVLPPFPRGVHRISRLTLSTTYPLGLFRIQRSQEVVLEVYVHPAPAGAPLTLMPGDPTAHADRRGAMRSREHEDFLGLRPWQVGESYRQVDWKSAARSDGPLQLKDYAGSGTGVRWLTWGATAGDREQRLSQLAKWVIEAHRAGLCYGLRLPDAELMPATGVAHRHHCLRALAACQPGARPASPAAIAAS
jgi:uncharacterized protein (DUF58 family)